MKEEMSFARKLLAGQKLGVLSTFSSEYPYTSLVGFSVTSELDILFVTKRDTHKFLNLKKHPRVSFLVNDAFVKKDPIESATAVTVLGRAEEVRAPEVLSEYKRILLEKNPFLSEFLSEEASEVVKISAEKIIIVRNLQKVSEIDL